MKNSGVKRKISTEQSEGRMEIKLNGKCYLDTAIKIKGKEYLFSIDLGNWHLLKRGDEPETGYKWLHILCFRVATLNRNTFDKWFKNSLSSILNGQETEAEKYNREDVM